MKRRKRGTGSISFNSDRKRWIARFVYEGKTIKRSFLTKTEADKFLADQLYDLRDGIELISPSLQDWMADFLASIQVKPTTLELYLHINKLRIQPYLGKLLLADISPGHVRRWLNTIEKRYAYTSTRNAYRLLRQALAVATSQGKIRRNPTDTIKLRSRPAARPAQALNKEQALKFIHYAKQERLYFLFLLAITTGLRVAELVGLRWRNIDINSRTIHIKEIIRPVNNKPVLMEPKSHNSVRSIPLDDFLYIQLLEHKTRMEEDRSNWLTSPGLDLVFPSESGTPLQYSRIQRVLKRILQNAELPQTFSFHHLRHTAASLMIDGGAPINDVSKILGHSSSLVTSAIYAHSYDESKRNVVANLSGIFQQEEGHEE